MLFHWLILSGGMILPVLYLPGLVVLIIFALDQMIFLPLPLISSTAWSLVPAVIYGRIRKPRKMVWAFIFGVFAQIGLIWIYFYAFCTVRNSKWMTREKRKERQLPAVGALLKKAPRR